MNEWTNEWTNGSINEQRERRNEGTKRTNEQTERTNGWMNESMHEGIGIIEQVIM